MDIYLKVSATPADDEPFTRGDLEQACQATLHEVFPVDDGMPVVPEVTVVDWIDRIKSFLSGGDPPITFVELEDIYGTDLAEVFVEILADGVEGAEGATSVDKERAWQENGPFAPEM